MVSDNVSTVYLSDKLSVCDNDSLIVNSWYEYKLYYRFIRFKIFLYKKKYKAQSFKKILFVSSGDVPFKYIKALQQQYPDKQVVAIIPLLNTVNAVKTRYKAEFFLQNKYQEAILYKVKNSNNINVYGVYCNIFSSISDVNDFFDIKYISPYLKSVRIFAKHLKPDIIHSEKLPFFIGSETEKKLYKPYKVLQVFRDFNSFNSIEPFWALLNILDKKGLEKLIKDSVVKKCIAFLFKLQSTNNLTNISEYIDIIISTYLNYKNMPNSDNYEHGKSILKKLNERSIKLFPKIFEKQGNVYNGLYYTLKNATHWCVYSDSYYKQCFNSTNIPKFITELLNKKKSTGHSVLYANDNNFGDYVRYSINKSNFRETKLLNKNYILKECSYDRIRTKFYDKDILPADEKNIIGFLDQADSKPLIILYCNYKNFNGYDIETALTSVLKIFENNKNIQVVINIPNGLGNNYINHFVEYFQNNLSLRGKWIFINEKVNILQYLASSDMILLPVKVNPSDTVHLNALKFGCIPIISKIGIYDDTIEEIMDNMNTGCGFKAQISDNKETTQDLYYRALQKALNFYSNNPTCWNALVKNAINKDIDWNFKIVEKYNNIYNSIS